MKLNCTYVSLKQGVLKEFSGEAIDKKMLKKNEQISECENHCDNLDGCQSFNVLRKNEYQRICYFRNKILNGNEPLMCWNDMYTVYKKCDKGK